MGLVSKTHTLLWFARRPPLWGQAANLALERLRPHRDTLIHRGRAADWCRETAVSTRRLLGALGVEPTLPVHEVAGAAEWRAAEERVATCPKPMGGGGHLDLLYACAESVGAMRVLETGVAYGWSSYALLLSLANRPGSHLVSTDMPYVQQELDEWVGCAVPDRLRSHWSLLRQADRQAMPKALKQLGQLDMCHYDSDKSYSGRLWAYPILWEALRPGGLLISDDVQDNEAFRHFVEQVGDGVWGVTEASGKYVAAVRKPG
mgnify:CR=1 FL=1